MSTFDQVKDRGGRMSQLLLFYTVVLRAVGAALLQLFTITLISSRESTEQNPRCQGVNKDTRLYSKEKFPVVRSIKFKTRMMRDTTSLKLELRMESENSRVLSISLSPILNTPRLMSPLR